MTPQSRPSLTKSNSWVNRSRVAKSSHESSLKRKKLRLKPQKVIAFLTIFVDKKPGGPAAKEDKNKKPGEEVISPEEKERIEREAREKEEKQAAF